MHETDLAIRFPSVCYRIKGLQGIDHTAFAILEVSASIAQDTPSGAPYSAPLH
jgi:hypothetical protein